ncbi:hypothetical protein GCM10009080_55340 [Cupriavidus pauculus]
MDAAPDSCIGDRNRRVFESLSHWAMEVPPKGKAGLVTCRLFYRSQTDDKLSPIAGYNRKERAAMLQKIIDAIRNREVLSFTYDGFARVVEPHAVGVSRAGNNVLRCYQIQGGHVTPGHEWDLCNIAKILGLSATGQRFVGERPGYKRGDKHMTTIFAEL